MTAREALENLKKLSETDLDLPLIAEHGSSGVSYDLKLYGDVRLADGTDEAGPLCDMKGELYIWAYLD